MTRKKKNFCIIISIVLVLALLFTLWRIFLCPTRILIVNALKAQQADFVLSNDSRHIHVDCLDTEEVGDLGAYDAIVLYGRRLFLSEEQLQEVKRVARKGTPVFTKTLKSSSFTINENLAEEQIAQLQVYFDNENRQNFRNGRMCLCCLSC